MTLEEAYRATTYEATVGGQKIALRIGKRSKQLDRAQIGEWVFITAWNPRSQECSPEENERRQRALEAELKARGKHFVPGLGIPDDRSQWEPEQSFLAWPVGRDEAQALRERFDQNAVVWGRAGHPAELLQDDSAS